MVTARQNSSASERDDLRVRRAQAGDPAAFDELIEAHRDLLERVVRHFVRNGDDVDDITQETWMRAATHIQDLREPSRFRPWLRSIARNSCMTFLKRQNRQRTDTLDDEDAPQIADPDEATPEEHLLSRDEQRKVWETLGALSERDRSALFYREYQGMPYSEIAERLGISRNAAEVCVFRARERFRRLYYEVEREELRCEFSGLQLSMYMDGDLDDITHRRILKHLSGCGPCTKRLSDMGTGRDIYRTLAGLVIMPGSVGGMWAGLQHLIAYIGSLFGGGGGAAGGGALAAGTATGGTAAAGMGVTGAATATGAAVAATGAGSGLSVQAAVAAPIAASILAGALFVQGTAPHPVPEDAPRPAAVTTSIAPAAATPPPPGAGSQVPVEPPSTTTSVPPYSAPPTVPGSLIADHDEPDPTEPEAHAADDPAPPTHMVAVAPPRAPSNSNAAAPTPNRTEVAGSGNPPAHAAASAPKPRDTSPGGPEVSAHVDRTGPPSHARGNQEQNGRPGQEQDTGVTSNGGSTQRGHGNPNGQGGGPPAHAQEERIVRASHAMTIESDVGTDRGGPPEHANGGGQGPNNGGAAGHGGENGRGNGKR